MALALRVELRRARRTATAGYRIASRSYLNSASQTYVLNGGGSFGPTRQG
jgi:hypothetical protein